MRFMAFHLSSHSVLHCALILGWIKDALFLICSRVPLQSVSMICAIAGTILILMGVNSKAVQNRLGHSTISITPGAYGHVTLLDATRGHAEMR
jgi:hypothetical protein